MWLASGADDDAIAKAYDLAPHKFREIMYGTRRKRKATALILATDEVINEPLPTREEMEAEPLLIIESHRNGSKVTPKQAFQRAHQMFRWKRIGLSNREIGKKYGGISGERVAQILGHHGFPSRLDPTWKALATSD